MEVKDHICTIDQAKRLKSLGVNQKSLFYYVNNWRDPRKQPINDGEHIIITGEKHITRAKGRERETEVEFVSAFTATELGRMILNAKEVELLQIKNIPNSDEKEVIVSGFGLCFSRRCKNEAEGRAELVLKLIESGLIVNEGNCEYKTEEEI